MSFPVEIFEADDLVYTRNQEDGTILVYCVHNSGELFKLGPARPTTPPAAMAHHDADATVVIR